MVDPLLVSIPEAAGILGIGKSTLFELLAAGKIKARKLGARSLIAVTDLEEYARTLPVRQTGEGGQ
jgi:excisionase family DNA binding protein